MTETKHLEPYRQELLLRVIDGRTDLAQPAYYLYCHERCDDLLRWLIANRMTGSDLVETLALECNGSVIVLIQRIIKRLDRDLKLKPVLASQMIRG